MNLHHPAAVRTWAIDSAAAMAKPSARDGDSEHQLLGDAVGRRGCRVPSRRVENPTIESINRTPAGLRRVVAAVGSRIAERVSPERTRRATFLERITVGRLSWSSWCAFTGGSSCLASWPLPFGLLSSLSVLLGVNWRRSWGRPVAGALTVVIVFPTLLFVAARSTIGFARWRLPCELWRRDVARLEE